ncbi:MAG: amidohydrolase family protein [Myxococcota bacterium]
MATTPGHLVIAAGLALGLVACGSPGGAGNADPAGPAMADAAPAGPAWRPGYARPPIVDMHGHIMPSGLERLETIMADNGLALVVNLSGSSSEDFALEDRIRKVFPRLVPFMNLDWEHATQPGFGARMAADLKTAVREHGYRGLKIPKILGLYLHDEQGQRMPVDWPELDPLWDMAGELDVPVAIHSGDPAAFWLPPTPDNERYDELSVHPHWSFYGPKWPPRKQILAELEHVIKSHPKTTFISVHFGNNAEELEDVARMLDAYPNMMIDVAARLGEFGRHPADKVRAFFVKYKSRIVFGTDIGISGKGLMLGSGGAEEPTMADVKPFYDAHWRYFEGEEKGIAHPTPIQGKWTIDAIDLPDDVLDALYFGNACRLLKVDPKTLQR